MTIESKAADGTQKHFAEREFEEPILMIQLETIPPGKCPDGLRFGREGRPRH
jgi:hypothetical protein